jgi:uncharacterized membrane protein YfcA
MYFPVADIEVQPWLPPLVAFVISFFTSMGGVSGAFLLLPFQVSFLGFDSPAVSGTNHIFNIVAIPSGVYRYIREGRMLWPLTWAVIIGTLPGVLFGTYIRIKYLPDPTHFKRFAAMVLLYIGYRLVQNIIRTPDEEKKSAQQPQVEETITKQSISLQAISYCYRKTEYTVSTPALMTVCTGIGVIGGIYGVGGGAIVAPLLVSYFNLPIYTIAGATLMGTMITSIAGVFCFHAMAHLYPNLSIAPDWRLGLLFGIGGMLGMYCGARAQKYVPARLIKSILAFCIIFISLRYIGIL